jgi:hypothetical protein
MEHSGQVSADSHRLLRVLELLVSFFCWPAKQLQDVQKEFRTHLREVTIEDKAVGEYENPCLDLARGSRPVHMKSYFSTRIEMLEVSVVLKTRTTSK